jgi:hypothetical protein
MEYTQVRRSGKIKRYEKGFDMAMRNLRTIRVRLNKQDLPLSPINAIYRAGRLYIESDVATGRQLMHSIRKLIQRGV